MLQIKKLYNTFPVGLRKFLVRAAIVFIAWRLLYFFVLQPTDFPDKQLIDLVLFGTYEMLHLFYNDLAIHGDTIFVNGRNTLTVAVACNGLELMVLYVGFLLCMPTTWKRQLGFALSGVALIIFLNMVRCTILGVMFYNNHFMADFAHHYLFKLAIYGVTFWLWVVYSRKYSLRES
jgi:exosortase/archaeosortase family protein